MKKVKEIFNKIIKGIVEFFKKILNRCKHLNETDRAIIVIILFIIVLFSVNVLTSMVHENNYNSRVQSGNDRWKQVDTIITDLEDRLEKLER